MKPIGKLSFENASAYLATAYPYHILNNTADNDVGYYHTSGRPWWFKYEFNTPTVVDEMKIAGHTSGGQCTMNAIVIAGSNDNSTWTTLLSTNHANNTTLQSHTFSNDTAYRWYRVNVTSSYAGDNQGHIKQWQLWNDGSRLDGTYAQDYSDSEHIIQSKDKSNIIPTAKYSYRTAYFCDGDSDYIYVPDSTDWDFGTGDFCIEASVNLSATPTYQTVIDVGAGTTGTNKGVWVEILSNNQIAVYVNGSNVGTESFSWGVHEWYDIAISRSGTSLRYFINGEQVGSTKTNSANITGSTEGVRIGVRQDGNYYLDGFIRDVRISDTARYTADYTPSNQPFTNDANTLLLLHGNQPTGKNNPLDACVHLDDGSDYYMSTSYNSDFEIFSFTDYTVDFYVRFKDINNRQYICSLYTDSNNAWDIETGSGSPTGWRFNSRDGGVNEVEFGQGSMTTIADKWYHVALVKKGSDWGFYVDGIQVAYTSATGSKIYGSGSFYIGSDYQNRASYASDGYLKNFRITKNNLFSANPVVGETDTISVPVTAADYATDSNTVILMKFDGTPDDISGTILTDSTGNHTVTRNAAMSCVYVQDWRNRIPEDSSGNGHVATCVGTAKLDWICVAGEGAYDGYVDDAHWTIPDSEDFNFGTSTDFCLGGWVKFTGTPADDGFISSGSSGGGWYTRFDSGHLETWAVNHGDTGTWSYHDDFVIGDWYFVTWSRESSTLRVFFNGELGTGSPTNRDLDNDGHALFIGAYRSAEQEIDGYMDAIFINNGEAVYTDSYIPPTYNFDNIMQYAKARIII